MGLRGPQPEAGERREDTLRIRLTDAERSELDHAAESAGQGTSTWARDVLLQVARGDAVSLKRPKK